MKILIAFLAFAGAVAAQSLGGSIQQPTSGSGNATTVNGASVPASQGCLGSNANSQLVAGTGCGASGVTSVGLSMPSFFCGVTGSPVTGTGTLTCAAATGQPNNYIIGSNSSGTIGLYSPATVLGYTPVQGPGSSTNTDLATFNGTTGALVSDSGVTLANVVTIPGTQTMTGTKTFPAGGLISAGTTSTDSGNLGSELTSSGTTTSTGWTGSYNSYTNGTSNTSPLTYAPTITSSAPYQVVITVSGYSAGSIGITFGGVALAGMSSNSTQTIGPKTTSTAGLVITPTSTFVGTVTASIKLISPISSFAFVGKDSTSANSYVVLQTLASLHNVFEGGGGTYNTTGASNSAQGYNALFNNTTGSNNSAQGYQALFNNTTGNYNSAQGTNALYSNTTGNYNSAQGLYALVSNTTGYQNTAQGYQALQNNTTGYQNTAQGNNALYSNTTGNYNTAQGFYALFNNTGGYNTAQGYQALGDNTTGGYNTAQGTNALYLNTTGGYNTAQGTNALYANTTASSNVAQGYNALYSNTTGGYNSAQGTNALYSNTTGASNTAQGYQAGYGTSSTNANTTGSNNTFVGYEAAPGSSTQQNYMTVIGSNATATCSSCVSLGRSGSDSVQNGASTWSITSAGNEKTQSIQGLSGAPSVTISGTGTCTLGSFSTGSNNIGGDITSSATCTAATVTLTWSGSLAYTNSSVCAAYMIDITAGTTGILSSKSTTSCTYTGLNITGASDDIQYGPMVGR